jgi:AcrR family transcriptional regulator
MRARAEHVAETRQRIVEAAAGLHGTVGPAATTIAAIADHAGVTRLTVYRHFPDEAALFAACSAHWQSQQQLPDPAAWAQISDPEARLRAGLVDLYRFFRAGADMLTGVYRDIAALPPPLQDQLRDRDARHRALLAVPFGGSASQQRVISALVGHAVSFWTWRSLCLGQGLSDDEAVDAMTRAVQAVTRVTIPATRVEGAPREGRSG